MSSNIESLVPIEYNSQRILTTAQLAEFYGTDAQVITNNYNRNKAHYVAGRDYFALEGEDKTRFLNQTQFDLGSAKNAKTLYLWYERGALLHAKSLGTDEAWKVYGHLVDCYFLVKSGALPSPSKPVLDRDTRAKAMLINAKHRMAQDYKKLYDLAGVKPEYQIMALQDYIGEDGPRFPSKALEKTRVTYDKGKIAERGAQRLSMSLLLGF